MKKKQVERMKRNKYRVIVGEKIQKDRYRSRENEEKKDSQEDIKSDPKQEIGKMKYGSKILSRM